MISKAPIRDSFSFNVDRKREFVDSLDLSGYYPIVEHWRNGEKLAEYSFNNGITNVGKNYLFDAGFNSGTQVASGSWYISLIDSTGYSALAVTDTMASHGGWAEFTGYSQSTRVLWGQGASSGQTVTNGTPATFDINAPGTLKGIFVTSGSAKSGTTGTLWSTGLFNADVPVASGDQFKITYAVAA